MNNTQTISLSKFKKDLSKLAAERGESYCVAECSIEESSPINFRGYINGYGAMHGSTPDQVLDRFRVKMDSQTSKEIKEIEVVV